MEKEASLPQEPEAGVPAVTCVIRMPDGTRASRRFALSHALDHVFTLCDARGAGGAGEAYQLVTQFPRRVFQRGSGLSLEQAGIAQGQELLLVEPLTPMEM